MYIPFLQRVLHTDPVDAKHFLALLGPAVTSLVVMERHKLGRRLRHMAPAEEG